MAQTHFGYQTVDEAEKARACAACSTPWRALRRHERPDVDGHAPRLEGLHHGRGQRAPATGCSTSPAAPATWRAPSPSAWAPGPGGAHRHQRSHAAHRPRPPARRGLVLPTTDLCDAEQAALRQRQLRPRQRGLRPAQHDPQGPALAEMCRVLRPAAGCWCWSSRKSPSRCASPTTGTRSSAAADRPLVAGTPTATATWPSRSACTPTRPRSRP
jgi:hypothetical protein